MAREEASNQEILQLQQPLLLQESFATATSHVSPTNNNNNDDSDQPPTTADARAHDDDDVDRNIPVMLWYQFLRCAPEAIWVSSVLSAYVYLLRPNNPELVGFLSAVEGITQFIAACLAGILADMYRRDVLLKITSIIGITASVLIVVSVTQHIFWILPVALSLNGAFDGIGLTCSFAVFADSIDDGQRSHYFTLRTLSMTAGLVLGPTFALVMFWILGDRWSTQSCSHVIITAQVLLVPAFILLWFFRDVKPSTSTDGENQANADAEAANTLNEINDTANAQDAEPTINDDDPTKLVCGRISRHRMIATCSTGSDILAALASGISFRYFAVFFLKDLYFGPVLVQILDALSCVIGAAGLVAAQKLSVPLGRCPVAVACKVAGIAFLLMMVLCYIYLPPDVITHMAIGILYVLQNAFFNSTEPLTRSLIMDNVPSNERAKWSALESINVFGWCGSAAIGGILVKAFHGKVVPVFFMTAGLHVIASLPLVALFGIAGKEQREQEEQSSSNNDNNDEHFRAALPANWAQGNSEPLLGR